MTRKLMMFALVVAGTALLLGGCGGEEGTTDGGGSETGDLRITLSFSGGGGKTAGIDPLAEDVPGVATDIRGKVRSVSAGTLDTLTVSVAQGYITFTGLTPASDYAVTMEALDNLGTIICSGTASNLTVTANNTTSATVLCGGGGGTGGLNAEWGTLLLVNGSSYPDTVAFDYVDYFYFDVASTSTITITVTPSAGDPDLFLFSDADIFDASGAFINLLDFSAFDGTVTESVTIFSAPVQTYYVAVYGFLASVYSISVTSP